MKLGYIHINRDEHQQVIEMLKLLEEPTALDELGIGRIRDFYADALFPGTSTLQKRIKYFSLMPQVYQRAASKEYKRVEEVRREIRRLEIILTNSLLAHSSVKTGITGSNAVKKNGSISPDEYVKYDPAYIYKSGLRAWEILKTDAVEREIFRYSKRRHEMPRRLRSDDESTADDAYEVDGDFLQFCEFPTGIDYDFAQTCDLSLTVAERNFIVGRIRTARRTKGSFLAYLVEHPEIVFEGKVFQGLATDQLPEMFATLVRDAQIMSDYIYLIHLRYNVIHSEERDEDMKREFEERWASFSKMNYPMAEIFGRIMIHERASLVFLHRSLQYLENGALKALDEWIIERERQIKGTRRKLQVKPYDPDAPTHYYQLSYRWELVSSFIRELQIEV